VLADQGHFPAIDISRSISRQAEGLLGEQQRRAVLQAREWISTHETSRTLIDTGLYMSGSNGAIDRAIERHPLISSFRKQPRDEHSGLRATHASLVSLVLGGA
jgi:flagellum-specific ATP synthase